MKRILLLLFVLFPAVVFAREGERILSYDSFIKVNPAGDMTVTETIKVVSEGNRINHGIYRDFPTRYKDRYNNTVNVAFQVRAALKDGKSEPWRTEDRNNGIRVYVGSKDIILRPGAYTYALTYRTDRQLGLFKKHDELYWNVTGNAWEFPIEKVTATVELPPGAEVLSTAAYTGLYGQKNTDFIAGRDSQGRAVFSTTRPLELNEGLTIVVTWPKGFVQEPTGVERTEVFFAENGTTAAGAAGIVVLLIYYLFTWLKIGKDPEKGVIIPLYEAPGGFSPAAVRYAMHMDFDDKVFAAAVVSMAVKGYLTIDKDTNGEYTLTMKGKDCSGISRDEVQIAKQLFRNRTSLVIKAENHAAIKQAMNDLRKSLAVEYEKIYFLTNKGTLIPGLLLSIITLVIIVLLGRNQSTAGFMIVWLSGWTAGCAMLVYQSYKAIRAVITGRFGGVANSISAFILPVFTLPFLGGEGLSLWMLSQAISIPAVMCIFIILLLNILFYHLMKAFTIKGRRVMDQIEGFKLYLSVAEKDQLKKLNPPLKTPELYENFLPYALALDVEQEWSEQFTEVLAQACAENGYNPTWYAGGHFAAMGAAGLASSLDAMSSSISSSSSPPGSSSGGGGGGSSGGGGGGGGGGGW